MSLGGLISGPLQATIGASAAGTASQEQAMGALAAAQVQQQMFNTANQALSPYYQGGASTLPTLQGLLTPGPSQTKLLSQLPGFQFASQWGNLAATNALAAQGLGGSAGPLAYGISQFNNGLAQQYWGQDVGALQNYANMGETAAGQLASAAGQAGANIGNSLQNVGNAQAQGTLGAANATISGAGQFGNSLGNLATLGLLGGGASGGGNSIYGAIGNAFNSLTGYGGGLGGQAQANYYSPASNVSMFS